MALTALDIYKFLKKSNCGECGSPTCLAFAMQLSAKKTELEKCPYVTDEAKQALLASAAPPIRLITIGKGDNKIEIGNETVLFRHEKTFYHQPGIAVYLDDNAEDFDNKLERIAKLKFERVGQKLEVELVFLNFSSGDVKRFGECAKKIKEKGLLLIIGAAQPKAAEEAVRAARDICPLIYAADKDNYDEMVAVAKLNCAALTAQAGSLEELAKLSTDIAGLGYNGLALELKGKNIYESKINLTQMRRLALRKNDRRFGYPAVYFTTAAYPAEELNQACVALCAYAAIIVVKTDTPEFIFPLLTLRQNIYTDPQKPIQIEAKVYEVGHVTADSLLMVTTNFSLTYFTVEGDIEASRVPCRIMVVDTEGTSVLTAWAAEKFTAERIAADLKKHNLESMINHRNLIIPGYVSVLSGKLEELTGWKILVGPRESSGIPAYLKNLNKLGENIAAGNFSSR
ncbi:MAG: acetyl-CoA decarbonylase/synthase complex subunit gamma [Candidatus Omnitrophota bacterium]